MACDPSPNPCSCVGTYTPPNDNCNTTCKCLSLGYLTVWPDDGVGPCGLVGTVSFTDCFDFCACDNEVATLTVVDVVPAGVITVNTITQSGLTYTTSADADAYDKVEVTIKATCTYKDDATVQLGDYTVITIFIKDLCKNINCTAGESCNKCNGLCEDDINLSVS